MNTITQTMKFRQALIEYSFKHGVTKAATSIVGVNATTALYVH